MKTLKDIAAAIDALPVEAFKNYWHDRDPVLHAMTNGKQRWENSTEKEAQDAREEADRERRRLDAQEAADERALQVKRWLKDGTLKQGTFIKVLGARDGSGIREFIGVRDRVVVCRQWTTSSWKRRVPNDATIRKVGKRVWIGQNELTAQDQITTHEFDKVSRILG